MWPEPRALSWLAAPQAADLPVPSAWTRRYGTAQLLRTSGATRVVAPAYSASVWTPAR